MKQTILSLCLILLGILSHTSIYAGKDPTVVEIETTFKTVREATLAAKKSLISHKFIPNGGVNDNGFTATRTTGSKSDYYTADVMTEDKKGKIIVTITFIKSGTGLLKLQKLAEEVKAELGGTPVGIVPSQNNLNPAAESQGAQVKEIAKVNCETYRKMKKGGVGLIIGGGVLTLLGTLIQNDVFPYNSTVSGLGEVMVPVGVLLLGGGITFTIIGSRKLKNGCALKLNVHPNGMALAYSL
jgi:hypothetical protein